MEYDAFISYSHRADGQLAPVLQGALQRFAKPWWKLRALDIFRDETGLSAASSLTGAILRALERARYFVLLASPTAAASKWCRAEIAFWLERRSPETLLIVLTEGTIRWDDAAGDFDWAATDALPETLRGVFAGEPFYLDLAWARRADELDARDPRFQTVVAKLAATLHGKSLEAVSGEDVRQHRRTRRVAAAAAASIGVLGIGAAGAAALFLDQREEARRQEARARAGETAATRNADEARRQERLAEQRRAEAERQKQLAEARRLEAEAATKRAVAGEREARLGQARLLTVASLQAIERQDHQLGALLLLESLRRAPDRQGGLSLAGTTAEQVLAAARLGAEDRLRLVVDRSTLPLDPRANLRRAFLLPGAGEIVALDGSAYRWRVDDGLLLRQWPASGDRLSPDGRLALRIGGADGAELRSRETAARLKLFVHESAAMAGFSPDGKWLATAEGSFAGPGRRTARLWEVDSGAMVGEVAFDDRVWDVAAGPRRGQLATKHEGFAVVWDVVGGRRVLRADLGVAITAIEFDAQGRHLLLGAVDGTVRVWDIEAGRELLRLKHEGQVEAARFGRGDALAAAANDGTATVWNRRSGERVIDLRWHEPLANAQLADHGRLLLTASEAAVQVWRIDAPPAARRIRHGHKVEGVAFSADGRRLVSWSLDGRQIVSDVASGARLAMFDLSAVLEDGHAFGGPIKGGVQAVLSPRGTMLAAAQGQAIWAMLVGASGPGAKMTIGAAIERLWIDDEGRVVVATKSELRAHEGRGGALLWQRPLAFPARAQLSPDGAWLLAVAADGKTLQWIETASGKLARETQSTAEILTLGFDAAGTTAIVATADGTAALYRGLDGAAAARFEGAGAPLRAAALSRDGRRLWGVTRDRVVQWNVGAAGVAASWPLPTASRFVPAAPGADLDRAAPLVSGDGRRFARFGDSDRVLEVFDIATGIRIAAIHHADTIIGAAFAADGGAIATASLDNSAQLVPLGPAPDPGPAALLRLQWGAYRLLTAKERALYDIPAPAAPPGAAAAKPCPTAWERDDDGTLLIRQSAVAEAELNLMIGADACAHEVLADNALAAAKDEAEKGKALAHYAAAVRLREAAGRPDLAARARVMRANLVRRLPDAAVLDAYRLFEAAIAAKSR
ncbi:MAG: TIR domain-containing protein [Rhodospirillaceae bacterium]|nr:TIR domain-containing protein [Rhodospirillaceae bacterium]